MATPIHSHTVNIPRDPSHKGKLVTLCTCKVGNNYDMQQHISMLQASVIASSKVQLFQQTASNACSVPLTIPVPQPTILVHELCHYLMNSGSVCPTSGTTSTVCVHTCMYQNN